MQLAHIGIAVRDLSTALPFYRDVLGLPLVPLDNADGANITGLAAGQALVELLEPVSADTPIGKLIDRRGPGIHHVCFSTTDLDGALDRCRAAGIRLIVNAPYRR